MSTLTTLTIVLEYQPEVPRLDLIRTLLTTAAAATAARLAESDRLVAAAILVAQARAGVALGGAPLRVSLTGGVEWSDETPQGVRKWAADSLNWRYWTDLEDPMAVALALAEEVNWQ